MAERRHDQLSSPPFDQAFGEQAICDIGHNHGTSVLHQQAQRNQFGLRNHHGQPCTNRRSQGWDRISLYATDKLPITRNQ